MNTKIKILDEDVANIIAAGEVVENPASMVKELLENSIDAGAKNIEILVNKGGKYVKITDDGEGMNRSDLLLSVERHATSKIYKKEDLYNLYTYGFRGEALASIASVSKMSIASKTKDAPVGNKLLVYGSTIKGISEENMKTGTQIEVDSLFYNTPARLKFLRTATTEYGKIKDIVQKEALANSNISVTLKIDDRELLRTSGKGIETTIFELFGKEALKNLIKFTYGYTSNMNLLKNNRDYILTYFNKRYAKSTIVDRAIIDSYYTKLMKDRYPFTILFFEIAASEIDVNIHPSKKIVKFSDERSVYTLVKGEIEKVIASNEKNITPNIRFSENEEKVEQKLLIEDKSYDVSQYKSNDNHIENDNIKGEDFQTTLNQKVYEEEIKNSGWNENNDIKKTKKESNDYVEQKYNRNYNELEIEEKIKETRVEPKIQDNNLNNIVEKKGKKDFFRIIGQVNKMYIVVENENSIEIYDQHAVHERILYEELMEKYKTEKMACRLFLVPEKISLDYKEKKILEENEEIIRKTGFEFEDFGDNEIVLRGVPDFDYRESTKKIFLDMLEGLLETHEKDLRENIIISMSCKGAIKAGEKLSIEEMQILIEKLYKMNKYTCPHGRPVLVKLKLDDIEKEFGRKG